MAYLKQIIEENIFFHSRPQTYSKKWVGHEYWVMKINLKIQIIRIRVIVNITTIQWNLSGIDDGRGLEQSFRALELKRPRIHATLMSHNTPQDLTFFINYFGKKIAEWKYVS